MPSSAKASPDWSGSASDMELVVEASNGREAVAQFRKHRPDITLMDLQMPEMNGFQAMAAIRDEFPEARIIVMTTYTGDVQVLRAFKDGAGLLIEKPVAQGVAGDDPCSSEIIDQDTDAPKLYGKSIFSG